jgi:hypothetical protein
MSTVASRIFRSTPLRDAATTWKAIVDLLTQGRDGATKTELLSIVGIAASLIADHAPKGAPIVVTCDGPRTRIYCIFDDDAVDGSDASEDTLGFDPLKGDWRISLPCPPDDLGWVQKSLAQHSTRVTAREPDAAIAADSDEKAAAQSLTLDPKGFIGS